jgi:hypothetical protein
MPRTAGAQLDAHEIDVYAIRGGRVAEARNMSIEPCATSAFYGRRVTRLSDPPAQFGLVGIRCHGGMAGKAGRRPYLTRSAGSISQTMISVSGGLP